MTESLRSLLAGVIDYAGLFPPASLSLEQAYANYCQYLTSAERWMLGRFICPIERAGELADLLLQAPPPAPIELCMLGKPEHGPDDARSAFDLLRRRCGESASLSAIELPAPEGALVGRLSQIVEAARHLADIPIFVEIPWQGDWRARWATAAERVTPAADRPERIGLKLRTGGVHAQAFPPADVLAGVLDLCRRASLPVKFTAGLHHPIRIYHESVQTTMHGFINVLSAGVMAQTHGMDPAGIEQILLTDNPADFAFDDYGMKWKTLHASTQRVRQVRRDLIMGFGSCSFDEPRDDLRALGWM